MTTQIETRRIAKLLQNPPAFPGAREYLKHLYRAVLFFQCYTRLDKADKQMINKRLGFLEEEANWDGDKKKLKRRLR